MNNSSEGGEADVPAVELDGEAEQLFDEAERLRGRWRPTSSRPCEGPQALPEYSYCWA
ncbi:MAG: hypothetical protein QW223_03725 [Candidatus Caldarchaeum sp.]